MFIQWEYGFEALCSRNGQKLFGDWPASRQSYQQPLREPGAQWMDGWHITHTPKSVPWWIAPIIAMTFLSLLFTLSSRFLSKTFCCSVYLWVFLAQPLTVKIVAFVLPSTLSRFSLPVSFVACPKPYEPRFAEISVKILQFPQFSINQEWFCTSHKITAINQAVCLVPLKIQWRLCLWESKWHLTNSEDSLFKKNSPV